jgi:hypothetical protein
VVEPRILHLPHSLPYEQVRELEISKHALDLWADCDIELDDWQEYVTLNSLVPNPETQKWAALEVGLDVSRQNGKGGIIEARLAVEVDIIKSALSLYSAHLYDTSMERSGASFRSSRGRHGSAINSKSRVATPESSVLTVRKVSSSRETGAFASVPAPREAGEDGR